MDTVSHHSLELRSTSCHTRPISTDPLLGLLVCKCHIQTDRLHPSFPLLKKATVWLNVLPLVSCLSTLICGPDNTNQQFEVSIILSPVAIHTKSHQIPFQKCWSVSVIHKLPDSTPDHIRHQFEIGGGFGLRWSLVVCV